MESLQQLEMGDSWNRSMGVVDYQLAIRPLVLGPGLYRVTVDILSHGGVMATRSLVLEVVTTDTPSGGVPLLHYPSVKIAVTQPWIWT